MASISELRDDPEHTIPRLLSTVKMLIEREADPDFARLLGWDHGFTVRTRLELLGLYPYKERPYSLLSGEPHWREPYTALDIVYDEQLRGWLLSDVQGYILSLCERHDLPAPVCARPDQGRGSILTRLREWCLTACEQVKEVKQDTPEPLSKRARIVYERLLTLKRHEAMTFPEIQDYYESETEKNLDEGTWKDLRRELGPYGLQNRPKVGYYIRPPQK